MTEEPKTEETDRIQEGHARVPPVLWMLYSVLVVICVIYFFTHLVRPS